MTRNLSSSFILVLTLGLFPFLGRGQSVEVAKDYYEHGLNEKAKDMLLTAIHSSSTIPENKAKALYLLGQISFDEGHIKVAINDWKTLTKNYPQAPEAKEIVNRLAELNEIMTKESGDHVTSVVAGSYLSNGDFWSKGDEIFHIDASWLPRVELAVGWYDRVNHEFPGTDAAEMAYEKKLFVLLGNQESGQHGESWGVKANFALYMPQVLSTFSEMESAFPQSSSLQAFRYQIAQAYWGQKDFPNAGRWLQKVIDQGNGVPSFYTETAKARLQNLKW